MNDLKFNLLDKIKSAHPTNSIKEIDLLNSGLASPCEIDSAIKHFKNVGFVKSPVGSDRLTITSLGEEAYESYQQYAESKAESERRYRKTIIFNTISITLSVIAVLIALAELFL